jgi:hypothetical protein
MASVEVFDVLDHTSRLEGHVPGEETTWCTESAMVFRIKKVQHIYLTCSTPRSHGRKSISHYDYGQMSSAMHM